MKKTLTEVLNDLFGAVGVGEKDRPRAKFLKVNPGTYSRIVRGDQALTEERAQRWAREFTKTEPGRAPDVATLLLEAVVPGGESVQEFCDQILENGGWLPADRIPELFRALYPPRVEKALLLIEYRDVPRAGPDAKYHELGRALGDAVAQGVNVGMLMPFRMDAQKDRSGSTTSVVQPLAASKATKYMVDVRDACFQAYLSFRRLAQDKVGTQRVAEVDERLRLYLAAGESTAPPNQGFACKTFYIQWDERDGLTFTRNHRVLQWVSNPARDLLIFREKHIDPEALRDAFFPIPHAFDLQVEAAEARLPDLDATTLATDLRERWNGYDLPFDDVLWRAYAPTSV